MATPRLWFALVLSACAGDADSVHVVRSWSDGGVAHYDLEIVGQPRHVARTLLPDGATVVVSEAGRDLAGAAQSGEDEVYVLPGDPGATLDAIPVDLDEASACALELALADELPVVATARQDNGGFPDTMDTTCSGNCKAQRDACSGGTSNQVIVALCNWIYSKCMTSCQTWGGGVFMP